MTTRSEERVRALLDAAAPEPTRIFDGPEIRRAAEESPDEVLPFAPRSRSTLLSAGLAVAAVVIIALIAVGLAGRGSHRASSPAASAPPSTRTTSTPVLAGPPNCGNTLVLAGGKFIGPSGGDGTITLTVRNSQRGLCTMPHVPAVHLTFDGGVVSTLPASDYQPLRRIVVGPYRSARIVVHLRAEHTCAGLGAGKTQLVFALDGFSYSYNEHLDGCQYSITSAQVHRGT